MKQSRARGARVQRSDSAEQTIAIGASLGRSVRPGTVIALSGDLGAGKTTLVKGIARGLGIAERRVHSPSFTLINEYAKRGVRLVHADLYRLHEQAGVMLGMEEYYTSDTVVVIEWPERAAEILPAGVLRVHIDALSEHTRKITIDDYERRSEE